VETLFQDLQQTFVIVAGPVVMWLLVFLQAGLLTLAALNPLFRLMRRG